MGGWYGYRASKAALNMFIKNISLEFARNRLKTLVTAFHPGTTDTELSKPFTKNTRYKLHSPAESAANFLKVFSGRNIDETGTFISWDGECIPW